MKKAMTIRADKTVLYFVLKAVITTVVSLLLYSFLLSRLAVHLDWGYSMADVLTIFICTLSSLTVGAVSLTGLKNHLIPMAMISELPLLLFSLFNLVFNDNSPLFFLIKAVIVLLCGSLCAVIKTKRDKRFKL